MLPNDRLNIRRVTFAQLFVWVALAACTEDQGGPVAGEDLVNIPADYAIYGMTAFMTASGVREGRVLADTAYMFGDSAVVTLHGMEVSFFSPNGTARATVTARYGEWDQRTDRMSARGDAVLIVHGDLRRIESQELNYDPERDRIWSDSTTVETLSNGQVTRGSAFESDLEFRNVRIGSFRGPVR